MIRAAFFDLDGTLVAYGSPGMSEQLRNDLIALRDKGIKTVLATGRSRHDLERIGMLGDTKFDSYVTFNGHCCYDEGGVYRRVTLCREALEGACRVLRENPEIVAIVECEDGNYLNRFDAEVQAAFPGLTTQLYPVRAPELALDGAVYQVVPFIPKEQEHLFLSAMPNSVATRWSEYATDIVPMGNGKADGIRAVLDRYGLKPEEIIAFGDGENDISMLKMAGIGVAMGNGSQSVKDAADYVTLSVHEDGVCAALRHFGVLQQKI